MGFDHGILDATTIPFENVYVASDKDTADTINAKLASGLHLVLSPGIYNLTSPLLISKSNQVVLGLGFATLVSANGNAAIEVASGIDGVRLGGVLLQAGPVKAEALLKWGHSALPYRGVPSNPGIFYDVFARVGGPNGDVPVSATTMLQIYSGNVIGDNMWLWRADHTDTGPVTNSRNPVSNGLQVFGDDVTMLGLAVEHTLEDLVKWEGNGGQTYFYQSEYPYDVNTEYGTSGFASYHVGSNVTSHGAWGIGVYHFFRDYPVVIPTGISCPSNLEASFVNPVGVYLSGQGHMDHVINDKGYFIYHCLSCMSTFDFFSFCVKCCDFFTPNSSGVLLSMNQIYGFKRPVLGQAGTAVVGKRTSRASSSRPGPDSCTDSAVGATVD